MTLKNIKKETVGLFVFGVVVIILVIIARIDWLCYKAVDTARGNLYEGLHQPQTSRA